MRRNFRGQNTSFTRTFTRFALLLSCLCLQACNGQPGPDRDSGIARLPSSVSGYECFSPSVVSFEELVDAPDDFVVGIVEDVRFSWSPFLRDMNFSLGTTWAEADTCPVDVTPVLEISIQTGAGVETAMIGAEIYDYYRPQPTLDADSELVWYGDEVDGNGGIVPGVELIVPVYQLADGALTPGGLPLISNVGGFAYVQEQDCRVYPEGSSEREWDFFLAAIENRSLDSQSELRVLSAPSVERPQVYSAYCSFPFVACDSNDECVGTDICFENGECGPSGS